MTPSQFPRRILLAVTGMSPQVVTETLYALVTERDFVPSEIRIITTDHGRNRILRDLLDERDGHFYAFCRDYQLEGKIHFDETCIEVIRDLNGVPLPDIRTPEENNRAADEIARVVQGLCQDPEAALHVSIAGGRKSMGFFLGYALSLFARPQDQLSHVLVSEPFENNRDFFYPPQESRTLVLPDGRSIDSALAKVMLADIPLVRLRSGLPDELLAGVTQYSTAVAMAQAGIAPVLSLQFDLEKLEVICGGVPIKLLPNEFATMWWMAKLRLQGRVVRPGDDATVDEYLLVYKKVVGDWSADYQNAVVALNSDLDFLRRFQENCSKIKLKLRKVLGSSAHTYSISSARQYTKTRYLLNLPTECIFLDNLE